MPFYPYFNLIQCCLSERPSLYSKLFFLTFLKCFRKGNSEIFQVASKTNERNVGEKI